MMGTGPREILKSLAIGLLTLLASLLLLFLVVFTGLEAHNYWKSTLPWAGQIWGPFVSVWLFGIVPLVACLSLWLSYSLCRLFDEIQRVCPEHMPKSFNPYSPWILFSYSLVTLFLDGLRIEDQRKLSEQVRREFKKWDTVYNVLLLPAGLWVVDPYAGTLVIATVVMVATKLVRYGLPGLDSWLHLYF